MWNGFGLVELIDQEARIRPQWDLYITAVPPLVALAIILGLLAKLALPRFPQWASSFIHENTDTNVTPEGQSSYPGNFRPIVLGLVSVTGLAVQAAALSNDPHDLSSIVETVAWVGAIILVAVLRPCTASVLLVLLYGSLLMSQLLLGIDNQWSIYESNILKWSQPCCSVVALMVILSAPLRSPNLPAKDISVAFDPPDAKLRSPEDGLTLWQWMTVSWLTPLLALGRQRQLNEGDVWFLPFEFHHRRLHEAFRELSGSVLTRLLKANGLDLIITACIGLIELAANSVSPLLLQRLLRAMEDPNEPRGTAFTFASISLVVSLLASQSDVFGLWFGRRCYERSRGEMITMLYEKTLSRKLVPAADKDKPAGGESEATGSSKEGGGGAVLTSLMRLLNFRKQPKKASTLEKPATGGKILNLMRNDVYEVSQRFWEFKDLVTVPLQVMGITALIWMLLGWPCLLGTLAIVLSQVVTAIIARILIKWEKRRRSATDQRLQIASQFVEAIRHLRWYGWQDEWRSDIINKRQQELDLIWTTRLWQLAILLTNTLASAMFPVIAFFAFTVLTKQPLRVDIAFPAIQLFQMLDQSIRRIPEMITYLINAKVALDRIQHFMDEPNKPLPTAPIGPAKSLDISHATFAWPGATQPVLFDICLTFSPGMTVIGGKVGSGKTALLLGLLGELDFLSGSYDRSAEAVGYCEQRPWLQSMSIRENILFHSPYDEARYKQVLDACMLIPDFAGFKHGDLSNIGENGIGLSGGQRARVALARAVYSRARVLMLDDPLSSLDHQTAESVVRKCFAGPLMQNRTLILVTHRLDLCRETASQYIEIADGRAHIRPVTDLPSVPSADEVLSPAETSHAAAKQQEDSAVPEKFIEDEHRAHGGIPSSIYWAYIKAGRLPWWGILALILTVFRLVNVVKTWFLKEWGEAYVRPGFFDQWPSPARDIHPWLLAFLLLSLGQAVFRVIAQGFLVTIAYFASQKLFNDAIQRVCYATFRFYDVTPIGRLMNRITSDMGMIDGHLSMLFQNLVLLLVVWASALVVVASVAPLFLLLALALVAGFVLIFTHFLPTSQSLRRLETTSLSPLISDFGALVDGLTTVRAFCAQYSFTSRVIDVTDEFQRMDHFYWSLQAWLMYRIENLSAATIFIVTILGLYSGISPGLIAFALVSASQFVYATHQICTLYGQLQMDFVSVERVVELIRLDQEPPGDLPPPAAWPRYGGDIVFNNVTVRYAPHLDPALTDVSFRIRGGSTTAIVGRTGSGKSTLAAALLATVTPEAGSITIDGVDIAHVEKQALRSRVTFLAQDPVLFPGTLRQNLDPLQEHADSDCERVLSTICGNYGWSLETRVERSGNNFSQGQRQLIGLARAILRRSAVVILDEATASIDMAMSATIQDILHQELSESTVFTIAHRAEAVRDATSCIVLHEGKLAEHRIL